MLSILCLIFAISLLILFRLRVKHNFPSGPFAWPLIGNVLDIGRFPHLSLARLSEKYGKLFQIYIGPYRVYVLSDVELIREVFHNPIFSGRPHWKIVDLLQGRPNNGLIFAHGEELVERRKFTLRNLRNFGFGKTAITESLLMEEINQVLANLRNCTEEPFVMANKFVFIVMNSLWMIIAGKRYGHDDPKLTFIFDEVKRMNDEVAYSPAFFWPKLGKWFPKLTKWKLVTDFVKAVQDFVQEHIDEHKLNISLNEESRDLIGVYLQEIERTSNEKSGFYKDTGLHTLRGTVMDLMLAGADTTSQTLAWIVLYICKHPPVQLKMQEELDSNVTCEQVTLSDRPSLPYTEAVILETLRILHVAPVGIFHAAMQDTQLRGYFVPRGTWLIGNLHVVHNDKQIWGDPQNFRPERFLNSDGTLKPEKNEAFMPFSVGKRACIGEQLARDTMFLIIANVFKAFTVTLAECSKGVGFDPKPGVVIGPEDYLVDIKERI